MPEDLIRYEALVLDALRGVVHAVLQRVQKRGVPGDHHFFITFDTHAPGVGISKRLKDQYPHEMTIVLQHQFWDLVVTEDRFAFGDVTLLPTPKGKSTGLLSAALEPEPEEEKLSFSPANRRKPNFPPTQAARLRKSSVSTSFVKSNLSAR